MQHVATDVGGATGRYLVLLQKCTQSFIRCTQQPSLYTAENQLSLKDLPEDQAGEAVAAILVEPQHRQAEVSLSPMW
jgi:hypothetical protein